MTHSYRISSFFCLSNPKCHIVHKKLNVGTEALCVNGSDVIDNFYLTIVKAFGGENCDETVFIVFRADIFSQALLMSIHSSLNVFASDSQMTAIIPIRQQYKR